MPPAKAQRRQVRKRCHFDRREKSFLDPSHSLGMTGMGSSTLRLGAFAGDSSAFGCSCSPTRRTSFFQRSLGESVYYYASRFARQAQILWPHKTSQTRRFLPPRGEERQVRITIFFAAFASLRLRSGHALREIFRIFGCGFAALGALSLTSPTPKSSAPQVSGSNGPSRSTAALRSNGLNDWNGLNVLNGHSLNGHTSAGTNRRGRRLC
jgi:hypothetical protein